MKIQISTRKSTTDYDFPDSATVKDLKKAFHKNNAKFYPDRQRFTGELGGKKVALTNDKSTLSSYGIREGDKLQFKDLGPQIGYQTVFLIEYFGPILFHAIFYYFPEVFYGPGNILNAILPAVFYAGPIGPKDIVQEWIFLMVVAHFVKRELETVLVHKFSHATMPIFNLFKNCSHYWISGGLLLAYAVNHPQAYVIQNPLLINFCLGLYVFAELSNLSTHITLSNLRPAGSTERKVPFGYGFNWVSCPNYFFEVLAWTSVTILAPGFISVFFWLSGAGQMWAWAVKKHKQYKVDFPNYPKRKVMFPFIA